MTTRIWENREYQISAPRILVNADKFGCQVFEITGPMGTLKVLALDESEAELAYKEEMYDDPEWCPECGEWGVACFCED